VRTETNGLQDVFQKSFNIKSSLDDYVTNLFGQVDSGEWETGTVYSEFFHKSMSSEIGSVILVVLSQQRISMA